VAGCVALTEPDVGDALIHDVDPLVAKAVPRKFSGVGDGLVIDRFFAAGLVPPAVPTKIKPLGCTNAPGLLSGDTTFSTTVAICGEFAAPDAVN
jgi:hypothetical protein